MTGEPLDTVIRGGLVVTPGGAVDADVGIRDGTVVAVSALDGATARTRIDADGLVVLPGAVDEHVHPVYLDDPQHVSTVAVHGGVTTLMHFAYAHPGESLLCSVADLRDAASGSLVDFTVHAGMFDAEAQRHEIPEVAMTGVRTFKVFLAYAAQGWMTDDRTFAQVLRDVRAVDGMLMVHCENGPAIDLLEQDAVDGALGDDPALVLGRTRPPVLEAEGVHRAISLAEAFDSRLFVVHVTSARALEVVAAARRRGVRVVAETCPQYLALDEGALRRWGALAKIGPPLRTPADNAALWTGLRDGVLQTVGSDHVPKKTPADLGEGLLAAGFGAPSLETMLPVLFGLGVSERRLSLARLAQVTSENPARAFGLWPQKGRVGIGADADLVLWDPAATQRLGAAGEHSRAGYSLYEGLEVRGRINAVLVRGQIVVRDGLRVGDAVAGGRFLPTGPFDPLADDAARAAASAEPLVRR